MNDNQNPACVDCGAVFPVNMPGTIAGYATRENGDRICYECCAKEDRARMVAKGRIVLYLMHKAGRDSKGQWVSEGRGEITNWPGTLRFPCGVRMGRHNIAGRRYDCWFAFAGMLWHGVQYGDNTQIVHCKQTKQRA